MTGAVLDIPRGGRTGGIELTRNPKGFGDALPLCYDGLGKEEEDGLGWYDRMGVRVSG